jgi:hypothetical protein
LPKQITGLVTDAVTTGKELTVTDTEAKFVLVQPVRVFVPVTVYVVDNVGVNAIPLVAEGLQVYVLAPPPLRVVVLPKQITELETAAVTTGNGFTVTETDAIFVLVQPVNVFVPATE